MPSFERLPADAEEALRALERLTREDPKSHMGSARTVGTDEVTDYVWVPLDDIKVDEKPVPIPILESLKRHGFVERYDECTGRAPGRPVGILVEWKIEHLDGVVETSEPRPPCDFYGITPDGKSYLERIAATRTGPQEKKLPKHAEVAYRIYEWAADRWPKRKGRLTDQKAYDLHKEEGLAIDGYELPGFDAWAKSVRMGRKYYGTQKNSSRRGRECPSAVSVNEIEPRAKDE